MASGPGLDRVDLAHAPDFALGAATVRPSLLTIDNAAQHHMLEPRVMQMLVALHRANGAPLSRDDLIGECWGGLSISDDAITQCVSKLRRALEAVPGVSVVAVPRVGYRLIVPPAVTPLAHGAAQPRSRLRAAAVAAVAVAVGAALLGSGEIDRAPAMTAGAKLAIAATRSPHQQQAERLHRAAVRLFRERSREGYVEAERLLRQAVALDPASAPAWARLAMVVWAPNWWTTHDDPAARTMLFSQALGDARRALALDPNLGEAHQAMAFIEWDKNPLPWIERAAVLAPDDGEIRYQLAILLARQLELRRAWVEAERALALDPTLPRVIAATASLRLRLGQRAGAYALLEQLGRFTHRANEERTDRFQLLFEEGRLTEAAQLCAQSLALGDEDRWWAQACLVQVAQRLGNDRLRDRMLGANPKLAAVISSDDPSHSLRLARNAPNGWWTDLFVGALARQLVNAGSGAQLLALYDERYRGNGAALWNEGSEQADTLAAPLIVALRHAGRTAEATDLRNRFAADVAKLGREGDRSARLPVGRAQLAALDGHASDAARWLDLAIDGGWKAQDSDLGFGPDRDPAFAAVRDNPRFRQAIAHFQAALSAEATAFAELDLSIVPRNRRVAKG